MEVILLEKVRNLGNFSDKVKVKRGYARNFLIPQGKAIIANKTNIANFEERKAELAAKAQKQRSDLEARAATLGDLSVAIKSKTSDEGKLYGSITVLEVYKALIAADKQVEKKEIMMPSGPIRHIGDYQLQLHLDDDLIIDFNLSVEPEA